MNVPSVFPSFASHTVYNQLPKVEKAYDLLLKNGNLEVFLEEARLVTVHHKIEDIFGFRLLHRHFSLPEHTIMVESPHYSELGTLNALVTKQELGPVSDDAVPASWIKTAEGWRAFEYSRDKNSTETLAKTPHLFDILEEFYKLLEHNNLHHLLAPAVLKKSWGGKLSPTQAFVERSYIEPEEKSIVTLEDTSSLKISHESMITTAWPLSHPFTHGCVGVYICEPHFSNGKKISHTPGKVGHRQAYQCEAQSPLAAHTNKGVV